MGWWFRSGQSGLCGLLSCAQKRSFKRHELEEVILDLLRRCLMQPEAAAQFIREYAHQANAGQASQDAERQRLEGKRAQITRRLDGLYDAPSPMSFAPPD